ncbi:valine--tRNA ligase [Candidatus Bathyarchaeota archaeon]|nr:valine--tRNA ligase [Candidatus Bathyarchaeota archaeon]
MDRLPKELNILEIERKWQKEWEDMGVYRFDWADSAKPVFSIDTPPPYTSGEFHMGLVLNWTYFDIVARYKRMRGCNVFFPQGWDCHGLPIEVEVEKKHGIKKTDVPPDKFRKLCMEHVTKYIDMMKADIIRLGESIDWSTEYKTMNPDYWRRTQLSYILLHEKGFMYRGMHPVNWCPRCETAIADAEVVYDKRDSQLYYIKFKLDEGGFLTIATSRPELIPACVVVAVNPEDERYKAHVGKKIHVPTTDRKVEIVADSMVDQEFGTGVVMICTYGDKADVKTVAKRGLPAIMCIDDKGKMTKNARKYAGMEVEAAKKAIIADLKKEGLLEKATPLSQEVSTCWRCHTPIEILEREQWFMKTRVLTGEVEKNALEITWFPDFMKHRLIDWAKSLEWDWVISRQRVFGTPIPAWYCKKCSHILIAKPDWVPIDPRIEKPKTDKCPACGSTEGFRPETDVFDTWMDSSITCAVHAGWPDREDWRRLFPASMHPSGVDIIRTWAYYLMVRHLALFNEKPYQSCLINGMVLGTDGREMHKSLGNYVASQEVLQKYGADATRQWAAAGGATGSDIPFRWQDVEYGWRFLIKLWNASGFVSSMLKDYDPAGDREWDLQLLDKWILSKAEKLTQAVTDALEKCHFNMAAEETRNFTWHVFCDCYIEAVKDRLYKPEVYGEEKRKAAQHTLYTVLYRVLQLFAPIAPHVTEEIYQRLFAEAKHYKSIHLSPWPTVDARLLDKKAEEDGDLVMALITEIRKDKAEKHKPLNAPIKKLTLYASNKDVAKALMDGKEDIAGTVKALFCEILLKKGEGREVKPCGICFVAEY